MLRGLFLSAALACATPVFAQDTATLADIRAELAQLSGQLQGLRSELVAGGSQGLQQAGGASALERMDAMEAALSRLTSQTEALGNRIDRVVTDGTNRVGDLEFRLCELEEGCDISALGQTRPLGGGAAPAVTAPAPDTTPKGPELAMNERSDFDMARAAYDGGDHAGAAAKLQQFKDAYPGSPLMGEAMYLRGQALRETGDAAGAARAWLDGFSADPTGARAADNLLELGQALGGLGQTSEACTTLAEVGARFPGSAAAGQASSARQSFGCP